MKTIALIPARAGSKGVPGKNVYPILGKPLIAYSIEAALQVKSLQYVWVSSDDQRVIDIAKEYPLVQIHKRSAQLATDSSPITDTVAEIFRQFSKDQVDSLLLLQPTSPIRTPEQIEKAIQILESNPDANSLISVCGMDDVHPARMYWMKDHHLLPIMEEYEKTRRQDIPLAWYRNGSIYLVRRKAFEESGNIMCKPCLGFPMPETQLLNIDTPRDLLIAELVMSEWKKGNL